MRNKPHAWNKPTEKGKQAARMSFGIWRARVCMHAQWPMNSMVMGKPQNSLICKLIPANMAIRFAKICSLRYPF